MLRGNLDIALIQPIFQREARMILADLYAGFLEHEQFLQMMMEIVIDEPLEGSTPTHPKRHVRTLVINDFENAPSAQIRFKWAEAQNPDDIEPGWTLCADEHWEEAKRRKDLMPKKVKIRKDPIDALDDLVGEYF